MKSKKMKNKEMKKTILGLLITILENLKNKLERGIKK